LGLVGFEQDALWDRLERTDAAPYGHEQEEAQVDQRASLAHEVEDRAGRLSAQVAQHQEVHDEDAIQVLVPGGAVANGADRRMVEPRQEEQDDHTATHGNHAPELGVNNAQQDGYRDKDERHQDAEHGTHIAFDEKSNGAEYRCCRQYPGEVGGDGTQHGVERREIPDRRNVRRGLQRIGRDEVVELQEVATHFRREEHNGGKHDEEAGHTNEVVH